MLSEIGSNFWIEPDGSTSKLKSITPEMFGASGVDYVWLSTGRASIAFALESIFQKNQVNRTVLLPPFTCHTVVEPFLRAGFRIEFFSIHPGLSVSGKELVKETLQCGAGIVLFHRYFGFDTITDCDETVIRLRKQGVIVIEDRTQCLYSDFAPSSADYVVGSIRKWFGTPDGGFCVSREKMFPDKPTESDKVLEEAKLKAARMKYDYLFHGQGKKKDFLQAFRSAEDILNEEKFFYRASDTALRMQALLNIATLAKKRQENFRTVLNLLKPMPSICPIFSTLPENVVPLYFPILVKDRSNLQRYLTEHSIYAPIVWPKGDCMPRVCPEAEQMYENLLCLPIDQRYSHDDMERMIECVNNYGEK